MIQVTVKNSKTGSQYICKSASKTVKDIAYKHISYYSYVDTGITRANHHGNTPRRSYQVHKTVTRI